MKPPFVESNQDLSDYWKAEPWLGEQSSQSSALFLVNVAEQEPKASYAPTMRFCFLPFNTLL